MDELVLRVELNQGQQGLARLLGLFPDEGVHAAFGVFTDFLHRAAAVDHQGNVSQIGSSLATSFPQNESLC